MVQIPPPQPKKTIVSQEADGVFFASRFVLSLRVMRPASVARWELTRSAAGGR